MTLSPLQLLVNWPFTIFNNNATNVDVLSMLFVAELAKMMSQC